MDLFLKLIDKVIELIKAHHENRRQLFEEVVRPLYDEFQHVLDAYFTLFCSSRADLMSKPLPETVINLRKRRDEYIQTRIRLIAMIDTISETFPETDLLEFVDAMKEFFSPLPWDTSEQPLRESIIEGKDMDMPRYGIDLGITPGKHLLNKLEHHGYDSTSSLSSALLFVDHTMRHMEESWYNISRLYAKLRINYLIHNKSAFKRNK